MVRIFISSVSKYCRRHINCGQCLFQPKIFCIDSINLSRIWSRALIGWFSNISLSEQLFMIKRQKTQGHKNQFYKVINLLRNTPDILKANFAFQELFHFWWCQICSIITWAIRPHAQFPWKTIWQKKAPYEVLTRQVIEAEKRVRPC